MPKLFIGIDVPAEIVLPILQSFPRGEMEETQENHHITFQYCGEGITDAKLKLVVEEWIDMLGTLPVDDLKVSVGTELALFGKENDVLVVKATVSENLQSAIAVARYRAEAKVKEIPASDFLFSAHVTLGKAHAIPAVDKNAPKPEVPPSFFATKLMFWGEDYSVRKEVNIGVAP